MCVCACVRPGLVRRQWRGSGVQPSSSPPTLTRSRSLWTQSDSRRTGRWLQSRRTRTRTGVMSELWGEVSDYFREVKNSPFFPSAILSCRADLKGATPVPGPTIMTGVSFSLGNLRLPFFTHRGTDTSPATASSPTQLIIIASRVFFSQLCVCFFTNVGGLQNVDMSWLLATCHLQSTYVIRTMVMSALIFSD